MPNPGSRVLNGVLALSLLALCALIATNAAAQDRSRMSPQACAHWQPTPDDPGLAETIAVCRQRVQENIHDAYLVSIFFTNIGAADIWIHQYQSGLDDLNEALMLNPARMEALEDRAVVYSRLGRQAEAFADYRAITRLTPRNAEEYLSIATAYFHLGQFDDAIKFNTIALRKFPTIENTVFGARLGRGYAYVEVGNYDLAVADCSVALGLRPGDGQALSCRCAARADSEQNLDMALADCSAALEYAAAQGSKAPTWLATRGLVYIRLGRFDDAIRDLDAALAISPRLSRALFLRGVAKRRKGDLDGAKVDILKAGLITPNIAAGFARLGLLP